jgi:hypothetical protein
MKRSNLWLLGAFVLILASLACNLTGNSNQGGVLNPTSNGNKPSTILVPQETTTGNPSINTEVVSTPLPTQPQNSLEATQGSTSGEIETTIKPVSEFPLPDDVSNFTELAKGQINFQTRMSLKEVTAFYQANFKEKGLTERMILHSETDTTLSMVFDGSANGMAIVVQAVDLGGGSTNVNIRYEGV